MRKESAKKIQEEESETKQEALEISIFKTKTFKRLVEKLRNWMILVALPSSFSAVAWSVYESHEKVKELDIKVKYLEDNSQKIDNQFERIEKKIDRILIKMAN